MPTMLAIYRGKTIGEAKLIAVSADPELIAYVTGCLLQPDAAEEITDDRPLQALQEGRKRALELIRDEAE